MPTQKIVFLHGLGQTPDTWKFCIEHVPHGYAGLAIDLHGSPRLSECEQETFLGLYGHLQHELKAIGEPVHLVGLSLGAMLALKYAAENPRNVSSLTMSGGQYRPSPIVVGVQDAVMRLAPKAIYENRRLSKASTLALMREIGTADLTGDVKAITVPTLIICGEKDRANKKAAREMHEMIPGSRLVIVLGGKHELNVQLPMELSETIGSFLASLPDRQA